MSLLNRLMGRGNQQTQPNQSEDYADYLNGTHEQPKHDSQFMQAGRTGYQGAEHGAEVGKSYEVPAGGVTEQQDLPQTEGVNRSNTNQHGVFGPIDAQQESVNWQHRGTEPVKLYDGPQTRGLPVEEPLTERRGSMEGNGRQHETGVVSNGGTTTYQEQPKSPRSPRKEGITSKVKRMFNGSKSERDRDYYTEGDVTSSQETSATEPTVSHTRDDTATHNASTPMTTHSDSAGGLSPRGNWNPTEGFAFRKSTTPPPHESRREQKAALAVAKHDGQMPTSGYDTPPEELSNYEGGSGYDDYGDSVPMKYDVPHSKPGRYASGEQGGAWGDHRASEVGSFRGQGMHSPSKKRQLDNSERPSWVAPGTSQSDPAITAAAAAGGAAAARAVGGGDANRRGSDNLSQERRGVSGESTALQGTHDSCPSAQDANRYERSESRFHDYVPTESGISRLDSGVDQYDRSNSGFNRYERSDSGMNRYERSDSGMNRFGRSDSGALPTRRDSLGVAQAMPAEQGINQYDRSDSGVNRYNRSESGINRSERLDAPRSVRTDPSFNRSGSNVNQYERSNSGVNRPGSNVSQYERSNSGMNQYERADSGVNRYDRSGSGIDRSDRLEGGVIQARPARRANSPTKQTGLAAGTVLGSGMTNRAEPSSDIRDYYQSTGTQLGSEKTLEKEPFGSGQSIGYDNQEGATHGKVNQQFDNMNLNDGQNRQEIPLRSESVKRDVGLQAGGQEFGFDNKGYTEPGYSNQGSLDRAYSGNNRNQEGYEEDYDNSGTKLGGKHGFGTQEAVHANRGAYNQSLQHPTSHEPVGQQMHNNQVGFDEGFRNHGQNVDSQGFENKPGYEEGLENRDPEYLRSKSIGSQGYRNQDVTDPQIYGVGGRTEAETPYQLGKKISDEKSNVRGYDSAGNQSPSREQSFGLGGTTTAQTPYGLGEKISDKSWNDKNKTGLNNDTFDHSGLEAGALGTGAVGMGAGAVEAKRMHGGTASEFQRSTSTGEPLMTRESEVALGEGKMSETRGAAAAATQHARTEQSDLNSSYVKEGAPGGPQSELQGAVPGMQEPPVSPRSQQYLQHGEPAKSPGLLTSAKYALGRAQNKLTNTHHHLTAGGGNISSVTGVAFGKLDVVAKRMLHGGEHLWREAFHPPAEEHLRKSFACLLSTETGAVAGVLYQSDHTLWFCSDRALQRAVKSAETHVAAPPAMEHYLYKVVLPLADVAHIESRANERSERDKSIKVEMRGGEQFWFFGFVTFEKALVNLRHAKEVHGLRAASMNARGA